MARSDDFLKFLDDTPSTEEVAENIAKVITALKEYKTASEKQLKETDAAIRADIEALLPQIDGKIAELERLFKQARVEEASDRRTTMRLIEQTADDIRAEFPPGYDDSEVRRLISEVRTAIPTIPPQFDPSEILERLEAIQTDIETSKKDPPLGSTRTGWGAHPLTIAEDGTTKAKVARHINFKGDGVSSVTRNPDGTIDVTISGGAGGVGPWSTPAETVDGSTTIFTVDAEPTDVVADGITLFPDVGYTYSSLQITLTNAPSIYVRYR